MAHSKEKKRKTKTIPETDQMADLLAKDFYSSNLKHNQRNFFLKKKTENIMRENCVWTKWKYYLSNGIICTPKPQHHTIYTSNKLTHLFTESKIKFG